MCTYLRRMSSWHCHQEYDSSCFPATPWRERCSTAHRGCGKRRFAVDRPHTWKRTTNWWLFRDRGCGPLRGQSVTPKCKHDACHLRVLHPNILYTPLVLSFTVFREGWTPYLGTWPCAWERAVKKVKCLWEIYISLLQNLLFLAS